MRKRKFLIFTTIMLIVAGIFSACKKTEDSQFEKTSTIINDNSSWATLVYGFGSEMIPCCVETQYVYFNGDSIVAGNRYKKVFSCDDKLHENIKYEGLIREQNKKTYFVPANLEKECLLYDFSVEGGMNFEYWNFRTQESMSLYVNKVELVEINGSMKKSIQITEMRDAEWIVDTWIEGIGSLKGILYPCLQLDGGDKKLLCYFLSNELVYKNPTYSDCYYDKPEDVIINGEF